MKTYLYRIFLADGTRKDFRADSMQRAILDYTKDSRGPREPIIMAVRLIDSEETQDEYVEIG